MKHTLLFLGFLYTALTSMSQEVTLTPNNFVDRSDDSKNYIVIEAPDKTAKELYTITRSYINSLYNSPKTVTTEIENKEVVVDGLSPSEIRIVFRLNGSNVWLLSHKYIFDFKDNRVRFEPVFKSLENTFDMSEISLVGAGLMGNATGIFNKNGKELKKKAVPEISAIVNNFVNDYKSYLNNPESKINNDNW